MPSSKKGSRPPQGFGRPPQLPPIPSLPPPDLPPGFVAPYVRTLPLVIEAMLDLGQVGPGDTLYDLGCGDGRIVWAAAQRGANAMGVELDPNRLAEARQRQPQDPITGTATFIQQDLMTVDLSTATVVTAYLLPQAHLKLRHKLQTELAPGSRILTHSFHFGDWDPTATAQVSDVINTYSVYLWTLP